MTTVTVTGYLYAERDEFGVWGPAGGLTYRMLPHAGSTSFGVSLGPVSFQADVPDDMDAALTAAEIQRLETERAEAGKKYAATVASINERLAKLRAITYEAA